MTEFYDIYQEAEHRSLKDLKSEWGIIKHDLDTNPFLTPEEREALERRLKEVEEMITLKHIDEENRRYKLLHSYGRWGL